MKRVEIPRSSQNGLSVSIVYQGDFFKLDLEEFEGKVNLILADPPFGVEWFLDFPFRDLITFYHKMLALTGVAVIDCGQPYSSFLVVQNPEFYKFSYIWEKDRLSHRHFIQSRPMGDYLEYLVFSKGDFHPTAKVQAKFRSQAPLCVPPGMVSGKYARTTLYHPVAKDRIHPGQKPVGLLQWLISAHTDPGDLVMDHVMGSGSTGVAANSLGCDFLGMELDEAVFDKAVSWLKTGVMYKPEIATSQVF